MSGPFRISARALIRFLGFDVDRLPPVFKGAIGEFTVKGGSAEKVCTYAVYVCDHDPWSRL